MILKKKSKTFNEYTLEISYGQIEAIVAALEQSHAEVIADELLAEIRWYIAHVPGPGEEEEDQKDREQGAAAAEEDFPIPMPPGQETTTPLSGVEKSALKPGQGSSKNAELPPPGEEPGSGLGGGPEDEAGGGLPDVTEPHGGGGPPEDELETDRRLPQPPARQHHR